MPSATLWPRRKSNDAGGPLWTGVSAAAAEAAVKFILFLFPFLKDVQQNMVKKEQHQQQSIVVVGIPNYTLRLYI